MKMYAQHGHGKSDKLSRALDDGTIDGIIFGPINEKPDNLRRWVADLSRHESEPDILIDPQVYVSTVPNATRDGHLPEYDSYYVPSLTPRDLTPRRLAGMAKSAIDFQLQLPVTRLIAPTIITESFTDRTAQTAFNLAEASMDYHASLDNPPPLLVSLFFGETALASGAGVEELLNTVSLYPAHGFYVTVVRSAQQYQQAFRPTQMSEWLLAIYSLAVANSYEVVCGYTDIIGVAAGAVGASAVACGWSKNLRMFDVTRFQPASGGRPARARYTSIPLLNSIYFSELQTCFDVGRITKVLTGTKYDGGFRNVRPDEDNWPPDASALHHWAALHGLFEQVVGDPEAALSAVERRVGAAQMLYADLRRRGVQFEPATGGTHLAQWLEAIEELRSKVQI